MQVESYGQELELELCRLYGKKSCKKCYGRGYVIYDTPTQFYKYETREVKLSPGYAVDELPSIEGSEETKITADEKMAGELRATPLPMHWADYCDCTKKRMAKAAK